MYGLIGKFSAQPGQRDAFVKIMLESVGDMPGCFSYVVAKDPADENLIWITKVWQNEANHKASLQLPAVKAAIGKAIPLIASFGDSFVTQPVGGYGLSARVNAP